MSPHAPAPALLSARKTRTILIRMLGRIGTTKTALSLLVASFSLACSGSDDPGGSATPVTCGAAQELSSGACIDSLRRYEPKERIDFDNVQNYGNQPTSLDLPDPPK